MQDFSNLKASENDLNIDLKKIQEQKQLVEEELFKQSNPNYNRVLQRIKQKRQIKIPNK